MIYTTISLVGGGAVLGEFLENHHIGFMGLQKKTQKIIPKIQMLSPVLEPLPRTKFGIETITTQEIWANNPACLSWPAGSRELKDTEYLNQDLANMRDAAM